MSQAASILAANPSLTLEDALYACMEENEMPQTYFDAWVNCLQEVYDAYTPTPDLADYAQAIYTVYTNPDKPLTAPIVARLSYHNMINGLTKLQNTAGTGPAYTAADIQPAVDNYYMEVTITVNTVGLIAESGTGAPGQSYDAGAYIVLTDNHPGQDTYEGSRCELNDEDLQPNMTIHWTAVAMDGTTAITLTEFRNINNWTSLASTPQSLSANEYYSRALPTLPNNTNATYSFNFTVAGSNYTYVFDPFIGDEDQ